MMTGRVIGFLVSTKTAVLILCLLTVVLLAGAFIMPAEEALQSVHSVPLLQWMKVQPLKATWWLWGSMGLLCVLAANTLFCSIDSLIKKRKVTQWLLLVSPQIIHAGFLFMLLAHLLSAMGGFKAFEIAAEGTILGFSDTTELRIRAIHISADRLGYVSDWAVDVEYQSHGSTVREGTLLPNRPLFQEGIGVYVRDLRASPQRVVLLELSREPGAFWALLGGILFMTGTTILLALKMKREPKE